MTDRQLFLTVSMAAAIPAAFGQSLTATSTRTYRFQPIGLGATETAQLNVHNTAPWGLGPHILRQRARVHSGTIPAPGTTPLSCTGSVTFPGGSGAVIGAATPFTLTAGQVFSAKLPFATSGGTGVRTIIVSEVSSKFTSGTPCSLAVSLETYDTSSGATHVEVTGGWLSGGR